MLGGGWVGTLASLFVEISQKGAEETKAAVDGLRSPLDGAKSAADEASKAVAGIGSGAAEIAKTTNAMTAAGAAAKGIAGAAGGFRAAFMPTVLPASGSSSATPTGSMQQLTTASTSAATAITGLGNAAAALARAIAAVAAAASRYAPPGAKAAVTTAASAAGTAAASATAAMAGGATAAASAGTAAKDALSGAKEAATGLAGSLGKLSPIMVQVQNALSKIGTLAGWGFAAASASTLGWVRAGLQGTGMAELMSFQFGMLSREIASVFLPTIRQVMEVVQSVTGWFRRLTGEQQASIRHWILGAVAALGVAMVMPKVVGGITLVIGGIKALITSMIALSAAEGVATAGIAPLIGLAVTAATTMGLFAASTETGRSAMSDLWAAIKPIFTAIGEAWQALDDAMEPVREAMAEVGREILDGIVSALREAIPVIIDFIHEVTPLIAMWAKMAASIDLEIWRDFAYLLRQAHNSVMGLVGAFKQLYAVTGKIPGVAFLRKKLGGLFEGGEEGPTARAKKQTPREDLQYGGGGFESVTSSYTRVAAVAARSSAGTSTPEEATAKNTESAEKKLGHIESMIEEFRAYLAKGGRGASAAAKGTVAGIRAAAGV